MSRHTTKWRLATASIVATLTMVAAGWGYVSAGAWGPYTAYDGAPPGGGGRECVTLSVGDNVGAPAFGISPRGATISASYGSTCGTALPRFANMLYAKANIMGYSDSVCNYRSAFNAGGQFYAITASVPTTGCAPPSVWAIGQYRNASAGWLGYCVNSPAGVGYLPPCVVTPAFPV